MANLNLSEFTEKTFVADADWTFVWDTAGLISKKVSRNSLLNSGTLATSAPVTISQTWDAGTNVMTAFKVVATDTASGSGSNLLELWAGSTPALKLKIDKNGTITGNRLILDQSGSYIQLPANTALNWTGTSFLRSASAGVFSFENNTQANFFILAAEAANTLALRNSTAPQTFNIYNTYQNAGVDFERIAFKWSSNIFTIGREFGGTGAARNINIIGGGSVLGIGSAATAAVSWTFFNNNLLAGSDNSYDIGASGANRPRNVYVGTSLVAGSTIDAPYIRAGSAGGLQMQGRFFMSSTADGNIYLTNNATTDFGRLQFGGTSASFPALKRSTITLQARLADDSAFAPIQGKLTTDTAFTSGAITDTGYIVLYDSTGTAYKVACTPV